MSQDLQSELHLRSIEGGDSEVRIQSCSSTDKRDTLVHRAKKSPTAERLFGQ